MHEELEKFERNQV
jgi:hypothetical protein